MLLLFSTELFIENFDRRGTLIATVGGSERGYSVESHVDVVVLEVEMGRDLV
jgi:hypothetical protein